YDKDPMEHEDAVKYDSVTFNTILNKNLRVMDLTAITLCKENNLPIRVFNINQSGYLKELVLGGKIGTLVLE
ncbi:MAG: UMP kinase, partial [Candidatus Neomarinimicrobiota bacterium]|nr:UMP kinase [Candidatus Neomarinimicrobiota bacterium]